MVAKLQSPKAVQGLAAKCALAVGAMALAVLAALTAPDAAAQQPAPQPAEPQQQQEQQQQDAWVKLCHPISEEDERNICLTHHERIDGNSGMVVVSAAIRQVEGQEQEHILITVPLGTVLPGGALLRVDEAEPFKLEFAFCHIGGCLAEGPASEEMIASFKRGGKLGVLAVDANSRQPVVFEIPLTGFTKAYDGPAVDGEKYMQDREQLMSVIRQRQMELSRRAAENAGQEGEGQQAPMPVPQ